MDRAGDLLKSFLSFYDLEKGQKYVSLFSGWKDMVGEDLASHARATDIRRGALLVEVDHPGWLQIIQMKQAFILKAIGKKYPELGIRVLHLRLLKEGTPFGAGPAGGTVKKVVGGKPDGETGSGPGTAEGPAGEPLPTGEPRGTPNSASEPKADGKSDSAPALSFPEPAEKKGGIDAITDEKLRNTLARLGREIKEKNRQSRR